jgi:hypothetical protein
VQGALRDEDPPHQARAQLRRGVPQDAHLNRNTLL